MEESFKALTLEGLFVRIRRLPAREARRTLLQLIYPERFVEPCEAAKAEMTRGDGGNSKWLIVDDATGELLGELGADEAAARRYLSRAMKRREYGDPEGVRRAS